MNKIILFLVLCSTRLWGQGGTDDNIRLKIDTLSDAKSEPPCALCLKQYLQYAEYVVPLSTINLLRGAICAFQCGDTVKLDYFVEKAAKTNWGECLAIWNAVKAYPENLPEFASLGNAVFEKKVYAAARSVAVERGIHFGLYMELDVMQREDQRQRLRFDSTSAKFPPGSPEFKSAQKELTESDAMRMDRIEEIIAQYGYPGKTLVGRLADVAWLVIQHASLDKQEKYLPLLTQATEKAELGKSNLAMLVDRIRFQKNQPQLYGSQVIRDPRTGKRTFYIIEDEANVNKRRAEVGLIPLEDYARSFDFEWPPK